MKISGKKIESNKSFLTLTELAREYGVGRQKLVRYVKQKLLPYDNQRDDGTRYYNRIKAGQRISKLKKLESEGYTTKEIRRYFESRENKKQQEILAYIQESMRDLANNKASSKTVRNIERIKTTRKV